MGMKIRTKIPRSHVASGSYIVSRKKRKVIEAYLGTCVGVSLCDRQANVGGLIHLLLPEPTNINDVWRPESYAMTGLPLFIKALCDSGAQKDRLEATVAGGALMGPLSETDLMLDIGGRTTEVVQRILDEERIPIHKTETGGYFPSHLSLDLMSWGSHIARSGIQTTFSSKRNFKKPTSKQLKNTIQRVKPIPQIALKIIRIIRDENYDFKEVAKEIRQDQIISAKVISLCNSALFQIRAAIDSIDRALVILGEKRLMQLVVSASTEEFFQETEGYSLCKGGLYQHALGTAMISESIADFTGIVSPDLAYTAGLLHDIGKVVLDQYMASVYPIFYRQIQENRFNLIDAECKIFGIAHTEAGSRLAESWALPEILKDTIKHHHKPEEATINSELTHIVYLADLIMSRFVVGLELEWLNTNTLPSRLQKIGLNQNQFHTIIEKTTRQIFNCSQLGHLGNICNLH